MAFGIDLGTTHSCVARIDDTGRPVIIKSANGEDTTPSVAYFESANHAIVGRTAKDHALIAPDLVIQCVKRDMGTEAEYAYHGVRHTPETVTALILSELARATQENMGEEVRDVVITVPAYFGLAELEATRRAGELAGLMILDVLAEPVAAALHYQAITRSTGGLRHILVYDLGGGTFDISVIRLDGDKVSVVCTDGDPRLGGADWDEAIARYLLARFMQEYPGSRAGDDKLFRQELLVYAERLKKDLSTAESKRQIVRCGGEVTRVELTRAELEELTASLLEHTIPVTERTIVTARRKGVDRFDDVLLVGGMTRAPAVTRILKERLGLDAHHHEPELAVAEGAALYALVCAIRAEAGPEAAPGRVAALTGLTGPQAERLAATRVASVVSRAIGVKSIDGRDPVALTDPVRARQIIVHLLPANTGLPTDTGPFTFHTSIDNQRLVGIEVWEQTGSVASEDLVENRKVGEGLLRNLPPRLPAQTPIEVTFYVSETGLLTVEATEPRSGSDLRFELQIGGLDQAAMEKARQSVARYRVSG